MNKSRRKILKIIAAAPIAVSLGFAGEALMRFVKPTKPPLCLFEQADLPVSAQRVSFSSSDFPEPWTCIPFLFKLKVKVFNPEQHELREIPAFAIRLQSNEIVAYSRICQKGCGLLNYVMNLQNYNCSCVRCSELCRCTAGIETPVLICQCDGSIFDLANNARVICGPARYPPRKFDLERQGNTVVVAGIGSGCIQ